MKPPRTVIMDLRPVWAALTARAHAGRLNEAQLDRALLDDLTHHRLTHSETLRLPPTLEWVCRFPEEFHVVKMNHARYLRRQCVAGRYQAVVRERLLRSPALVNLFAEGERVDLIIWLLSFGETRQGWVLTTSRARFAPELIAAVIETRICDQASAIAFLRCEEGEPWRFFHGSTFARVITRCASLAPKAVLDRRALIEQHMIEFDPETGEYHPPLPQARTIMRSILMRPLNQLFEMIQADLTQRAS
jgi:hypothetical protein